MEYASLQKADLWLANLQGANLTGANLQGARLQDANLQKVRLQYTNFQGAYLKNTNLRNVEDVDKAQFDENTILPDGTNWQPDIDMSRFTDPNHPNFWHISTRPAPTPK